MDLLIILVIITITATATYFVSLMIFRRQVDSLSEIKEQINEKKQEIERIHEKITATQEAYKKNVQNVKKRLNELKKKDIIIKDKIENLRKKDVLIKSKNKDLNDSLDILVKKINIKKNKLSTIEQRTKELIILEGNASLIKSNLNKDLKSSSDLKNEIQGFEDTLYDLKAELDLYSRIKEYVGYGIFEEPEYLHETPERYQAEIKLVRDKQKSIVKENKAVELAEDIEIEGSSKNGAAVLKGQAKLMLRTFNIECDNLLGKLNPSNFDRTLERIEKIAEGLEKTTVSLSSGMTLPYIELKFEECRLLYEYKLKKAAQDEEQRLIREQMREEARLKKEYENSITDAKREEKLFKGLLEKAQAQLGKAHEEEKGELENQVLLLETQLKEAQEKEQRAKSMAEQTRKGHVYIVSNIGSFGEDVYKIGLSRRLDPLERVKELGGASVPFHFDVHAMIYSDDAPALESALHNHLNPVRLNAVNRRKEFFQAPLREIKSAVEEIAGDEADFIMTAAAEEYYETLRLQGDSSSPHAVT